MLWQLQVYLYTFTTVALNNSILMQSYCHEGEKVAAMAIPPKKTPEDFIFGKYLGDGSSGTVYLGVDVNTRREYAIKVCEKSQILREGKQDDVRRERDVMRIMSKSPGFVDLMCTFQDKHSLYFVMTYAKKGDLLTYINRVGAVDVNCTRHYVAELVLCCEQLNRVNVVHCDLKPENILLDDDMHTLIGDFGSAKILTTEDTESSDDNNEYDGDSPLQRAHRRRQGRFVGTPEYMSPEMLTNGAITPAVDLWSLGCIVYQMISGSPPFRGSSDYMIFRQILDAEPEYPAGFDEYAKDLVQKLLKRQPVERLGAQDMDGCYKSIREHAFFMGIDFDAVRQQTPPPMLPYLPGKEKVCSEYMKPVLDDAQLGSLLTSEFDKAAVNKEQHIEKFFDLTAGEMQKLLEEQKCDKWHAFADNELILKKGNVMRRKGLFAKKRMLLLTTGPRLIFVEPQRMIKNGEIPWSAELHVVLKNFNTFFVDTPSCIYCLEDLEGYAHTWVDAIEIMSDRTYGKRDEKSADSTGHSAAPTQRITTETSSGDTR